MRPEIAKPLEATIERWRALDLGDTFDPGAAAAVVETGLSGLCVPVEVGGLGASMAEAAEVLLALGAVDGSSALGFAMQVHVTGAIRETDGFPASTRDRLWRAILDDGALLNNAVADSVPENFVGQPSRVASCSVTARTESFSGPVTFTTVGGDATRAKHCSVIALASPCQMVLNQPMPRSTGSPARSQGR